MTYIIPIQAMHMCMRLYMAFAEPRAYLCYWVPYRVRASLFRGRIPEFAEFTEQQKAGPVVCVPIHTRVLTVFLSSRRGGVPKTIN